MHLYAPPPCPCIAHFYDYYANVLEFLNGSYTMILLSFDQPTN
jgi:hypothetical protein